MPLSRAAVSSLRSAAGVSVRLVSLGGASASRSSTSSSGAKARIAFPSALACTGSSAPTSRIWSVVSGRKTWWTTTTVAPCITPTRTAASVALGEPLGVHYRAAAQLVQVEVGVAELEQAGAELVLVRVAVLLDEAVGEQRLEQAVDGGAGELEPVRELAHTQPPRSRRKGLQNASSAVDRLDRAAFGCTLTIRYCRIHFDSVD